MARAFFRGPATRSGESDQGCGRNRPGKDPKRHRGAPVGRCGPDPGQCHLSEKYWQQECDAQKYHPSLLPEQGERLQWNFLQGGAQEQYLSTGRDRSNLPRTTVGWPSWRSCPPVANSPSTWPAGWLGSVAAARWAGDRLSSRCLN
jgi:hypothetical protein